MARRQPRWQALVAAHRRALQSQNVRPKIEVMLRVTLGRQQLVDQPGPLVRRPVRQKLLRLLQGRHSLSDDDCRVSPDAIYFVPFGDDAFNPRPPNKHSRTPRFPRY